MKAIINTNIVMADHMIPDGAVVMDGGKIVDFGRNIKVGSAECFDAQGQFTGPGLLDIHIHSAAEEKNICDEPKKNARRLLEEGITGCMAALYFSSTAPQLIEQAQRVREAMESGDAPNLMGLYMEAPYMNPKYGADRNNNPWKGDIKKEDYMPLLDAFGDIVKVWGVAPERENIEMFVKDALAANPKAIFSAAHCEPTPYQVQALQKYGLKCATHHTNATGNLAKYPECRGVCVDEAVWYSDDIYAELICDKMGIHVDPFMLRLVKKIKGRDKVILISDCTCADQFGDVPIPEGYDGVDDIGFDNTGEIAGTRFLLPRACRNMMYHTGSSLCDVFKFASINPAEMLGLADRGEIGIGKRADLIITDALFGIKHVFFEGEQIK